MGWGHDPYSGTQAYTFHSLNARSKWVLSLPDTDVTFIAGYSHYWNSAGDYNLYPGYQGLFGNYKLPNFYDAVPGNPSSTSLEDWNASLDVEHNFGWAKLVSITGYNQEAGLYSDDGDVGPTNYVNGWNDDKTKTTTEELRLQSVDTSSPSWLTWTTGFYGNGPGSAVSEWYVRTIGTVRGPRVPSLTPFLVVVIAHDACGVHRFWTPCCLWESLARRARSADANDGGHFSRSGAAAGRRVLRFELADRRRGGGAGRSGLGFGVWGLGFGFCVRRGRWGLSRAAAGARRGHRLPRRDFFCAAGRRP